MAKYKSTWFNTTKTWDTLKQALFSPVHTSTKNMSNFGDSGLHLPKPFTRAHKRQTDMCYSPNLQYRGVTVRHSTRFQFPGRGMVHNCHFKDCSATATILLSYNKNTLYLQNVFSDKLVGSIHKSTTKIEITLYICKSNFLKTIVHESDNTDYRPDVVAKFVSKA